MTVREKIKVIPQASGNRVDIGGGSSSNLILTGANLQNINRNMMGYSLYKPGLDTKQKIHLEAEELVYVVTGSGKLTVGTELVPFLSGDSIFIPPGVPHGVRNDGEEDVEMVFFFSSPEYPKTVEA
jgi:mannose-6-phosphate isomerase-like protein (cupin superfamily)